ncbi:hypothetical protein KAT80_02825 [Candidatus Pacearchaeota archaeon]|nr:hypothetical protein [Candidatus Pacearchaeota archaeon]
MNLKNKKSLAVKVLKLGRERIVFLQSRLEEIKDAITKQDIRDLKKEGAIVVKEIKGRKKVKKKKKVRGVGKIKKKVNKRKQEYVKMTRKLRKHVAVKKKSGELSKEEIKDIRNKIRNRKFSSLRNLKEYTGGLRK